MRSHSCDHRYADTEFYRVGAAYAVFTILFVPIGSGRKEPCVCWCLVDFEVYLHITYPIHTYSRLSERLQNAQSNSMQEKNRSETVKQLPLIPAPWAFLALGDQLWVINIIS